MLSRQTLPERQHDGHSSGCLRHTRTPHAPFSLFSRKVLSNKKVPCSPRYIGETHVSVRVCISREIHEEPIRRALASGQVVYAGGSIWLTAYHVKKKLMYFEGASRTCKV